MAHEVLWLLLSLKNYNKKSAGRLMHSQDKTDAYGSLISSPWTFIGWIRKKMHSRVLDKLAVELL